MAETSGGLSGPALGALSIGALLVYAGFRGVSPLQALKDVSSGKPPAVANTGGDFPLSTGPLTTLSKFGSLLTDRTPLGNAVAAAAKSRSGEKYSQAKRLSPGYSDCSSFAAEAFTDVGVTGVKTWWTTLVFRSSPLFQTIDTSSALAGDIIITPLKTLSGAHMAIVTGPGTAIGQQNPRSNVQEGPFSEIMAGKSSYIAMRYVGALPARFIPLGSAERPVN